MYRFMRPLIALALLTTPYARAQDLDAMTGTVVETIDVGNYVYFRLAENEHWMAAPPFEVAAGNTVEVSGGYLMKDFYSSTLDRTFDWVMFVNNARVVHEQGGRSPETQVSAAHEAAATHAAQPFSAPAAGEIPPLEDGLTIGQVLTGGRALDGREVRLRARVMKVSYNIMGKNWVTLQDGTGTAPDNALVATTLESVYPGTTVTVAGVIAIDVSLGYGYDYAILLEEARFSTTATAEP